MEAMVGPSINKDSMHARISLSPSPRAMPTEAMDIPSLLSDNTTVSIPGAGVTMGLVYLPRGKEEDSFQKMLLYQS